MRIGHLIVTALAGWSFVFAQSGLSVPESHGIVVTGDFNEDGCDDVLLFGVRGSARTYYGQETKPYFRKGFAWFGPGYTRLRDVPVFVGKHLYAPVLDVRTNTIALHGKRKKLDASFLNVGDKTSRAIQRHNYVSNPATVHF